MDKFDLDEFLGMRAGPGIVTVTLSAESYAKVKEHIATLETSLSDLSARYLAEVERGDGLKRQAEYWQAVFDAVDAQLQTVTGERDRIMPLAKLGAWALDTSREHMSDVDGGDIQDQALGLGILEEVTMEAPCSEYCVCAEYYDEFPAQCMRYTKVTHDFILSMKPLPTQSGGGHE